MLRNRGGYCVRSSFSTLPSRTQITRWARAAVTKLQGYICCSPSIANLASRFYLESDDHEAADWRGARW